MTPLATASAVLFGASLLVAGWAAPSPDRADERRASAAADSFPHQRHARLFTACDACHEGIERGDTATRMPRAEFCASCHDGSVARRVEWAPRPPRPTNVRFTHPSHPTLPCESCHATSDTAAFLDVGRARPGTCLPCHAPEAPEHLAQAGCTPCHGPLSEARGLAAAEIARFSRPRSHDSAWVFAHRTQAGAGTCAVCHAGEFCASCHVNAGMVAPIQALASDERVAALARARRPIYPQPASHRSAGFTRAHGQQVEAAGATCSNCHARESCLTCHREEERAPVIARLPRRVRGGARGVDLAGIRPPDHGPDMALRHRTPAAGGDAACSRCHAPSFCASCHAGAATPSFHGPAFVERHAERAFTRENDCAACHQTEVFCLDCHRRTGQARTGAPFGRYHDAQGTWLFGHGGAARRTIETCAACHRQNDCLRCHSPSGGWRVSPHGPGFDPTLADRNPAMCRTCHRFGIPGR